MLIIERYLEFYYCSATSVTIANSLLQDHLINNNAIA